MTRSVVAVIAAYDERHNIEAVARRAHAALSGIPGVEAAMIFVVEGSDGTREILEQLARELPRLAVLYRERPSGLGSAFRRGFDAVPADADAVVTLDADLNHQPEEIPRLLAGLEARHADIVVGSRFVASSQVDGTPLWKRLLSGTMNVAMGFLWGLQTRDKTSGFRCYRAAALRRITYRNADFGFLPEMLICARRLGLVVVEEPIHFVYRRAGKSKLRIGQTIASYLALIRARFTRQPR